MPLFRPGARFAGQGAGPSGGGGQQGPRYVEVQSLDNVDASGGSFHIPAGNYEMELSNITDEVSENSGNNMLVFWATGCEGHSEGKKFRIYCVYGGNNDPWKLKQTLLGFGIEIPKGGFRIDIDACIGARGIGYVDDDSYQGNLRSVLKSMVIPGQQQQRGAAPIAGRGGGARQAGPTAGRQQGAWQPPGGGQQQQPPTAGRATAGRAAPNGPTTGRAQPQQPQEQEQDGLYESDVNQMVADDLEAVVAHYGLNVNLAAPANNTIGKKRGSVIKALDAAGLLLAEQNGQ